MQSAGRNAGDGGGWSAFRQTRLMHAFFFTPGPPNLHEVTQKRQLVWRAHGKRMGTREHMLEAERRWAAEKVRGRGRRQGKRGRRGPKWRLRARGGGRAGLCHLGLSRQFLPAHTNAARKQPCQLADVARRVSMRPAQALWQPRAVGSLEGAARAHPAQQNHSPFNQLRLHSPQSFALHASQEPHRAVFADLAAAVLCGFAGPAASSPSSVGSTSCALACSSALRLSCFAGDTPLCLESTVCQNSSNSRSVIRWLHSRLRDSIRPSCV